MPPKSHHFRDSGHMVFVFSPKDIRVLFLEWQLFFAKKRQKGLVLRAGFRAPEILEKLSGGDFHLRMWMWAKDRAIISP